MDLWSSNLFCSGVNCISTSFPKTWPIYIFYPLRPKIFDWSCTSFFNPFSNPWWYLVISILEYVQIIFISFATIQGQATTTCYLSYDKTLPTGLFILSILPFIQYSLTVVSVPTTSLISFLIVCPLSSPHTLPYFFLSVTLAFTP